MSVKVSLIVAAYSPGDAVNRLIDSLDLQTLPQDEFEVIFVDDGSPDDTAERLRRIASTRPNYQVYEIENSGWPSRPRNVGMSHATGEYLMFVDHDDSLFPDGLRRAYEYAHDNNADILSPKESKTNDTWWGTSSMTAGNIPNVLTEQRVNRLNPMVPHKLYRRSLVEEHNIRFPEGSRVLWEDWYINLDTYRRASVVSVLADQPVYLWHASDTNSSHTFHPSRVDYWDRLGELLQYISTILDGDDYHGDQITLMEHNVRTRVIDRCVRLQFQSYDRDVKKMAMERSKALLEQFATPEVLAALPKQQLAQSLLIRNLEMGHSRSLHETYQKMQGRTKIDSLRWDDGVLRYETIAYWEPKDPQVPGYVIENGRVVLDVPRALRKVLPPETLDHTDNAGDLLVEIALRNRYEYVTWELPVQADPASFTSGSEGPVVLVQRGRGTIDLATARLGRPLEDAVWDLRTRLWWTGMNSTGALGYSGKVQAAITGGRGAVAYANKNGGLTIDLAQRLRTLAIDGKAANGSAGRISDFSIDLTKLFVFGEADIDSGMLFAVPEDQAVEPKTDAEIALIESLAANGHLGARIVSDGSKARLVGSAELAANTYRVYARRDGTLYRTNVRFVVDKAGRMQFGIAAAVVSSSPASLLRRALGRGR